MPHRTPLIPTIGGSGVRAFALGGEHRGAAMRCRNRLIETVLLPALADMGRGDPL
jgi:hypothetical protein